MSSLAWDVLGSPGERKSERWPELALNASSIATTRLLEKLHEARRHRLPIAFAFYIGELLDFDYVTLVSLSTEARDNDHITAIHFY